MMRQAVFKNQQRFAIGISRPNNVVRNAIKSCCVMRYDNDKKNYSQQYRSMTVGGNPILSSLYRHQPPNFHRHVYCNSGPCCTSGIQKRQLSSWMPEVISNINIWGGSGFMLKTLHMDGTIPYWACFAILSIMVRTALIPVVIYAAHVAQRFGKVSPEIQFIITLFQNDLKKMRQENKSLYEQRLLFQQNFQTVRAIYKLHNINPLAIFASPAIQIPIFWYVATDLRKIVNGADPQLAQDLTTTTISMLPWITDLTDPDPWYGLPVLAGVMLYANVEVAIGKRSLSGPASAKSDFALLLKDAFQTLAIFMPCFVSQSPAGIQIYVVSSFTFTLFQGMALRNNTFRSWIQLAPLGANIGQEPKYAKEFMEFKKLEQKARELRGDGPVLGTGVLAVGFETSFAGTNRPTSIKGSGMKPVEVEMSNKGGPISKQITKNLTQDQYNKMLGGGPFIPGVSAPPEQIEQQLLMQQQEQQLLQQQNLLDAQLQREATKDNATSEINLEEQMKAANLGVKLAPKTTSTTATSNVVTKIDPKQFKQKSKKKKAYKKKR